MGDPDLFNIGPAGLSSGRLELHCAGAECSIHPGGKLFTALPNERGTPRRHAAAMLHEGGRPSPLLFNPNREGGSNPGQALRTNPGL